ncbi:MAG TPA: nitronate monooxygenase [Devosia sp.]|nr:nitronate monooxygenase [Devosia sp.]
MHLPPSPACDLLGNAVPIVLAGMGGVARSELVAAVTDGGGFGFLGMVREPAELIEQEVERLRQLGHRRFGVNIIPAATNPMLLEHQVAACIRLAVPVVGTFWDLDQRVTRRLRDAGILVVHQVGSVDEAIEAARAGVEIVIAQGREAGGHVRGVRPLRDLLPDVVSAVKVPVLAAGGLATGGDLVTAMALGAAGIVCGTALMATEEAFAHAYHKQRLLAAETDDTVLTSSFHINWPASAPVRVLKSAVTSGARGDAYAPDKTVIGADAGRPIYLFSTDSPLRSTTGDIEAMALYAGTGVGHIAEICGAGDWLRNIVAEAENLLALESDVVEEIEASSPVCYANEMQGDYTGLISGGELASELWLLTAQMHAALRATLALGTDTAAPSQPPFAPGAVPFASWVLRLKKIAISASQGKSRHPIELRLSQAASADPILHHALILQGLGALVPRVAASEMQGRLVQLRNFIESSA